MVGEGSKGTLALPHWVPITQTPAHLSFPITAQFGVSRFPCPQLTPLFSPLSTSSGLQMGPIDN